MQMYHERPRGMRTYAFSSGASICFAFISRANLPITRLSIGASESYLIITSMIYRSKSMRAGATNAEGARCCRVATVFILVVIAAAICVLVSFAQDMRTTTFICLEILTLVAWPLVFAVVLTIDSRK